MRFKYIGLKVDGERAFKETTGIEWMPGSEHDVADQKVAEEMLKHPTIWEPVQVALGSAKSAPAAPTPAPATTPATVGAVDPLAGMDDKAVKAFAKSTGLVIPGINAQKGDKLREKVRAALVAAK